MRQYRYDLHIHSCLSPCADNDMTPGNIVGMAKINGLDIIALTDHNSCKNVEVCEKFANEMDIIFLPGVELNTSEEVHVVCLFESVHQAKRFDSMLYNTLPDIDNNTDIFGNQYVTDDSDEVVSEEHKLLITASEISINDIEHILKDYNGFCFPAHVDRGSYSVVSNLGMIPQGCLFPIIEVYDKNRFEAAEFDTLRDKMIVMNSDSHVLHKIADPGCVFETNRELKTAGDVIAALIEISGKKEF